METVFGLSTSLVSFILVTLIALTVAAAMWSAQIVAAELRERR